MKDYIIFDRAPIMTFTYNGSISDWYVNTTYESEKTAISGLISTDSCRDEYLLSNIAANITINSDRSADYSKKSFQIKFSETQSLFGLNNSSSHKNWVLLSEYDDNSMLRDALALYMGQQIQSEACWIPTFTFVHFYIQDNEQTYYMGLYLLVDQKEQVRNRVDIFKPEDGYTGTDIGYFFERNDNAQIESNLTFTINNEEYLPQGFSRNSRESNRWARIVNGEQVTYDTFGIYSKITDNAQITYLKDRLLKIYEILFHAVQEDSAYEINNNGEVVPSELSVEAAVRKVINIDSFVNAYILHEIVCSPNIGHSSFFFSLDMSEWGNKLLTLCCPWNFSLALGNAQNFAEDPEAISLWAKQCSLNPWIALLPKTDWFMSLVTQKWQALYEAGFMKNCLNLINDYSKNYESEFTANFSEWSFNWQNNNTWNIDVQDKAPNNFVRQEYSAATSERACASLLYDWVNLRFKVLHEAFEGEGPTDWDQEIPEQTITNLIVFNNKDYYEIGENLDLIVIAQYSDGTESIIYNYVISGYDSQLSGDQVVTVIYQDASAQITVTVAQPPRPIDEYQVPDYEFIKKTRDYIIFENAPKLVFNYNESEYPFSHWYTSVQRETEPKPEVPGTLSASNCDEKYSFDNLDLQYIRVRGNYTVNYRKKALKIKFSEKQNLFGLNQGKKAKEWLLLADYGDNSMLRNALAFYMGQKILRTQWSPTFTFVQVYVKNETEENYLGLFLLCDQKETGKNRVNINEPEKNYTGVDIGYFFERDNYYEPTGDEPGFTLKYSNPSDYKPAVLPVINHETNKYALMGGSKRDGYTIHSKIYSDDQPAFLKKYMGLIYTIMYEACINNTCYELNSTDINNWQNWALVPSQLNDPEQIVGKVIDLKSFVDMYLLQEFLGNPDLAHSSFYFCLDASAEGNKKLALTCPWDHDRTLGLCDGLKDANYEHLWAKDAHYNPWISLLAQSSWFVALLKKRWQELYNDKFFSKSLNMLEDYKITYKDDFAQNYQKYNIRWENDYGIGDPKSMASINRPFYENVETEADCEALLRDWINLRFGTLHARVFDLESSTNWPQPPIPTPPDPPEPPDPPGPEPDPGKDGQIFRKDKLVKEYAEDTWNQMYNRAASQADQLTKLWNMIYSSRSNAAVLFYNKMYMAVASGKSLSDPELQAEIRAWNAQAAR